MKTLIDSAWFWQKLFECRLVKNGHAVRREYSATMQKMDTGGYFFQNADKLFTLTVALISLELTRWL